MEVANYATRNGWAWGAGEGTVFRAGSAIVVFAFRDGQRATDDGPWASEGDEVIDELHSERPFLRLYVAKITHMTDVVARTAVSTLECKEIY